MASLPWRNIFNLFPTPVQWPIRKKTRTPVAISGALLHIAVPRRDRLPRSRSARIPALAIHWRRLYDDCKITGRGAMSAGGHPTSSSIPASRAREADMLILAGWLVTAATLIGPVDGAPALTGSVVTPDGRPVPEAEVVLTAGAARDGSVPVLARTTTGRDGRFRLDRPDPARLRDFLSPGVIWAYRPGYGLGIADLLRADKPDQPHRLVVEPQDVRRLTIRDPDGRPVAGARVAARLVQTEHTGYMGVTIPDGWLDRLAATTDARGVAALPGLTRRVDLRSAASRSPGAGRTSRRSATTTASSIPPSCWEAPGGWRARSGMTRASRSRARPSRSGSDAGSPLGAERSWYVIPERVHPPGGPIRTDAGGTFRIPATLASGRDLPRRRTDRRRARRSCPTGSS